LSAPPDLLATIRGGVLFLRGRGGGREKEAKEMEGRARGGDCILFFNFWLAACTYPSSRSEQVQEENHLENGH